MADGSVFITGAVHDGRTCVDFLVLAGEKCKVVTLSTPPAPNLRLSPPPGSGVIHYESTTEQHGHRLHGDHSARMASSCCWALFIGPTLTSSIDTQTMQQLTSWQNPSCLFDLV